MSAFQCLYYLENSYLDIIEVKTLDLPEIATAAERFHWLRIEKESLKISQLTFRSMDSSGEVEERYFEEGFLKFNQTIGTFIEKYNSAQHPLHHRNCTEVPPAIQKTIGEYLSQLVSA